MKDIARIALQKGMILGKDVFNYRNELIFPEGTKVDENVIAKLARHSIMAVSIKEDVDFATTHFEKVRLSDGFKKFEDSYNTGLLEYKTAINRIVSEQAVIPTQYFLDIYYRLRKFAESGNVLLDYLYNMIPNEDELTHTHCFNSALIAGVFADWMSMSPEEKDTLILSGFYYDIGKLLLPNELLWKSGKLTDEEFETIKSHPRLGLKLARTQPVNEHVLNAIYMHHERFNGTGYPAGLKLDQIDIFARYIAIIDGYEAMTSPRTYRQALTPLQIIDRFEAEGVMRYDGTLLRPILKRIADTQIGLNVKLSDDSTWEILVINPARLSRPILRRGDSEFLNLNDRLDLQVVSIH